MNNPLRYTDPSGYEPLDRQWEQDFYDAHGRDPTDQDRRDRLFSLIFLGSGPGGAWTDADWAEYGAHKANYWGPIGGKQWRWAGEMEPSLERFVTHVERLSAYYYPWEESQFVSAFAFVWGGVPLGFPVISALQMGTNPGAQWSMYPPLHEGTAGWQPALVDDENPSHHYAGSAYVGYYFGAGVGITVNWLRDGPWSDLSLPDLTLGDRAALHGYLLRYGSMYIFGHEMLMLLSVAQH